MPNDSYSEVVTRPSASPYATGNLTTAESIFQSGQTLTLNLTKTADVVSLAHDGLPRFTANLSEALSVVVTKTATAVTAQFALDVIANLGIVQPDGSVNPFTTNLDIQGTVTFTPQTGGCHIDYKGQWCDANLACGGSDGLPRGTLSLDDAVTSYAFSNPGADGFAAVIIGNNAVTTGDTTAEAPDPSTAAQGAAAAVLTAALLEAAFGTRSDDPGQGYDHADGDVLRAMGEAALTMIAHPTPADQTASVDAVVAATVAGAKLALVDGLAAYDVLAAHQGPLGLSAPGDILLG